MLGQLIVRQGQPWGRSIQLIIRRRHWGCRQMPLLSVCFAKTPDTNIKKSCLHSGLSVSVSVSRISHDLGRVVHQDGHTLVKKRMLKMNRVVPGVHAVGVFLLVLAIDWDSFYPWITLSSRLVRSVGLAPRFTNSRPPLLYAIKIQALRRD